jgi:hypothetical protein
MCVVSPNLLLSWLQSQMLYHSALVCYTPQSLPDIAPVLWSVTVFSLGLHAVKLSPSVFYQLLLWWGETAIGALSSGQVPHILLWSEMLLLDFWSLHS